MRKVAKAKAPGTPKTTLFRNMGKVKPRRMPQTGKVKQNLQNRIRRTYSVSGTLSRSGFGFGG